MNRIIILVLLPCVLSCSSPSIQEQPVSNLSPVSLEINQFDLVEFPHIPFSGVIDKWKIGESGFTILSKSTLYHYADPDQKPMIFDSKVFLELQGCVITDFAIAGSKLYLLCEGKGTAHRFDLVTQSFETTFDLGVDASRLAVFQDRLFLYQPPNTLNRDTTFNFHLLTFPLDSPEKIQKYLSYPASPTDSYSFNVLTNQSLANTENEVIFSRIGNDTLIRFNRKGEWVGSELLQVLPTGEGLQAGVGLDPEQIYFPLYLSQSEDWRWYSLVKNSSLQTLIHHLPTGKKSLVNKVILSNGVQLPFLGQEYKEDVYLLLTEEAFIEFNTNETYPEPFLKLKNYETPFLFLRVPLSELPA
ncbi:hypothetical protein [Algoriphagus taiwanensis]|uniref:6-bladed beta-propeller protein n=1 Tax=Algoriphagus taiwanensis TaxID=1445656 RepID=A0ABQ6PVL1_9BACT|nr:hypothetical protein Ataiwa_02650 [Algoriphagus taiwanensis]